jgi:hypothetical protein
MDAHVFSAKSRQIQKRGISPLLLGVILLTAILPFLLLIFYSGQTFNFISQADEKSELRVWVTPAQVIASKGSEIELSVMAHYDHSTVLIPSITVGLDTSGIPAVGSATVSRLTPFKGEVLIGKVIVKPTKSGVYSVGALKERITITPQIPDIDIIVTPAKITVK